MSSGAFGLCRNARVGDCFVWLYVMKVTSVIRKQIGEFSKWSPYLTNEIC